MSVDVMQIAGLVSQESRVLEDLRAEIGRVVVGQAVLVDRLLMALLCNQHVLIEGVPGLAKTLTVTALAKSLQASFHRIQFTPDLLPSDVVGTLVYNPKTGEFTTRKGPVFANIVLADEINRAPAKVQSALLEAMQERQVTVGETTFKLDDPFLVLATQNPIEQEGTYPLPEAQTDRFLFKVKVGYPAQDEELKILRRMAKSAPPAETRPVATLDDIRRLRRLCDEIFMDQKVEEYIVHLVDASRDPAKYKVPAEGLIRYGASPRATIGLAMAARAYAFLQGRGFVTPQDVKTVAPDVLRHRIAVSYEAEAEEVTSEAIVARILATVEVP